MSAILTSLKLSLGRLHRQGLGFAESIPEDKFTAMPSGLNHPAWIFGHLNLYCGDVVTMLAGDPYDGDHKDAPLFAPKSVPVDDPGKYPLKQQLVEAFDAGQTAMLAAIDTADESVIAMPFDNKVLPTRGGMIVHLMIDHPWYHLGQLACWRKAIRSEDS